MKRLLLTTTLAAAATTGNAQNAATEALAYKETFKAIYYYEQCARSVDYETIGNINYFAEETTKRLRDLLNDHNGTLDDVTASDLKDAAILCYRNIMRLDPSFEQLDE